MDQSAGREIGRFSLDSSSWALPDLKQEGITWNPWNGERKFGGLGDLDPRPEGLERTRGGSTDFIISRGKIAHGQGYLPSLTIKTVDQQLHRGPATYEA